MQHRIVLVSLMSLQTVPALQTHAASCTMQRVGSYTIQPRLRSGTMTLWNARASRAVSPVLVEQEGEEDIPDFTFQSGSPVKGDFFADASLSDLEVSLTTKVLFGVSSALFLWLIISLIVL